MNAPARFPQEQDAQAVGFLEYRARQIVRQLRREYGSGGTRELLDEIQNDEDRRQGK